MADVRMATVRGSKGICYHVIVGDVVVWTRSVPLTEEVDAFFQAGAEMERVAAERNTERD